MQGYNTGERPGGAAHLTVPPRSIQHQPAGGAKQGPLEPPSPSSSVKWVGGLQPPPGTLEGTGRKHGSAAWGLPCANPQLLSLLISKGSNDSQTQGHLGPSPASHGRWLRRPGMQETGSGWAATGSAYPLLYPRRPDGAGAPECLWGRN